MIGDVYKYFHRLHVGMDESLPDYGPEARAKVLDSVLQLVEIGSDLSLHQLEGTEPWRPRGTIAAQRDMIAFNAFPFRSLMTLRKLAPMLLSTSRLTPRPSRLPLPNWSLQPAGLDAVPG